MNILLFNSYYSFSFLFLIGLAVGSFLNVVSFRYQPSRKTWEKEVFWGRSHCLFCKKKLSWYELIPLLSFLIQGGKCRSCKNRISFQYPVVELLGGLIFVLVPLFLKNFFFYFPPLASWIWVFAAFLWILVLLDLLLVFLIDLKHYLIPNILNLLLLVLAVAWIFLGTQGRIFENSFAGSFLKSFSAIFPTIENVWLAHLAGALVGGIFFFLIVLLSAGKAMGMGDVKLIFALGLLFGWPDILLIIFVAFILGALVSLILILLGKKKVSDLVPFGPFIVLAAVATFFFGAKILSLYFAIIGM